MKVQGLIEIDHKTMTDEEFEEFNQLMDKYFVNYKELSVVNGREYDSVILRDINLINDSEDEEGVKTYGILTLLSDRNIIINGMWDLKGIPYGQTQVTEQISEEESITKLIGEPLYSFDLNKHIKHTPDTVTYDEQGNEIGRTKAMQFRPLHKFSGWGTIIEY